MAIKVLGTTVIDDSRNLTNIGTVAVSGNVVLGNSTVAVGVQANGSYGTAGQILHSNGTATYWATDDQGVTSVASGNGLTGGTITSTGTLSVVAGTGTIVNATGVHVNSTYIGTLSANNTTYVNGKTEGNLNVNNATTAYGKTEGNLNVNNATTAYGKTEGNLNVNAAAQLTTARTIGDVSFNGTTNIVPSRIIYKDTRSTDHAPYTYPGVSIHLKTNTTDSLVDGGTYHGVLDLAQWTDTSGGSQHQLGFTGNGNIWSRYSTNSTAWSSWNQVVTTVSGTALTANNSTNLGGVAAANYARTDTADDFAGVVTFNANAVLTKSLSANASYGSAGQVLTSGGTGNTYWATPAGSSVNTAAQYAWTNTHSFSSMVTFSNATSQSNTTAAAWFNQGVGTVAFDTNMVKRISWNDGAGNFNIRAGNYYNGTALVYINDGTNGGAATISLNADGADGVITFNTWPIGASGGTLTGGTSMSLNTTALSISGQLRTVGRYFSNEWIQMDNYSGLYSPLNGAHFYPNDASYGSWRIAGSRNGWGGIEFTFASTSLMMNTDVYGFHYNGVGWRLHSSGGSLYVPGDMVAYWSDRRLKENLRPIGSEASDILSKLTAYRFNWNDRVEEFNIDVKPGKEEIGLIAQEVQAILPDAVTINKTGSKLNSDGKEVGNEYLTIRWNKITPLLVQALNDTTRELNELKKLLKDKGIL